MLLRTLDPPLFAGKTVLYRAPYDIKPIGRDGGQELESELRMTTTLATLQELLQQECKIVILNSVGRPRGVEETLRTRLHATVLSRLLRRPVGHVTECIGGMVREQIYALRPGELLMLENTRFHEEDVKNDPSFAKELARNGECIVFDAFTLAHRTHASVCGILNLLPSVAGTYCMQEVNALAALREQEVHAETVLVLGGAKLSDKISFLNHLLPRTRGALIGGAMAFPFLEALGFSTGGSFHEDASHVVSDTSPAREQAASLLRKFPACFSADEFMHSSVPTLLLPADGVVQGNNSFRTNTWGNTPTAVCGGNEQIIDIGTKTRIEFCSVLASASRVFWNGPLGLSTGAHGREGSVVVARGIGSVPTSVVGGGDTVALCEEEGLLGTFSHVSLAGGATLAFLAGEPLPALELLRKDI